MDVKFITRDVGYVVGERVHEFQNLYRTTDGGVSWTQLSLSAGRTVDFVGADHGWVVNGGGPGYRTTDGGVTWQEITLPGHPVSVIITEVDFISQNVGWAVGWYGYAANTTDGGVTWRTQNISPQGQNILGLRAVSESEAYAVGVVSPPSVAPPNLYHTTDGGTTWTISPLPAEFSLEAVFATTTGNIWTSGFDGTVLHKAGAGSTLQLVAAASRRSHRNAGTFDIPLPLTGTTGVECRDGGGNYSFGFAFSNNLVSGSANVTAGTGTAGIPTIAGTTMTVPLSGVTDVQTVQITLTDVTDEFSQVLPPSSVSARMLIGDATGDGEVNGNDVTLTKSQVGVPVTGSNFREDVRVSGTITSADVKLVKGAQGHGVP